MQGLDNLKRLSVQDTKQEKENCGEAKSKFLLRSLFNFFFLA